MFVEPKLGIRLHIYLCLKPYELTKSRSKEVMEIIAQVRDKYKIRAINSFDFVDSRSVMQPYEAP